MTVSPDGSLVAAAGGEGGVRLYDAKTGALLRVIGGGGDRCVVFSPDGKTIASGGTDTSVILWKAPAAAPAPKAMTAAEAWESLDSLEAGVSYRCMDQLIADRAKTVPFLDERFKNQPAEQAQIQRWIKELDHDEFRVRETARRGLIKAGLRAAPALTDPQRKPLGLRQRDPHGNPRRMQGSGILNRKHVPFDRNGRGVHPLRHAHRIDMPGMGNDFCPQGRQAIPCPQKRGMVERNDDHVLERVFSFDEFGQPLDHRL